MTLPLSTPAITVALLAAHSAAKAEACGLVPDITAVIVLTAAVQIGPPTQPEFHTVLPVRHWPREYHMDPLDPFWNYVPLDLGSMWN